MDDKPSIRELSSGERVELRCQRCKAKLAPYVMKGPELVHELADNGWRPTETINAEEAKRRILGTEQMTREGFQTRYGCQPEEWLAVSGSLEGLSLEHQNVYDKLNEEALTITRFAEGLKRKRAFRGPFTGKIHKVETFNGTEKWIWDCRCGAHIERRLDRLMKLPVDRDSRVQFALV